MARKRVPVPCSTVIRLNKPKEPIYAAASKCAGCQQWFLVYPAPAMYVDAPRVRRRGDHYTTTMTIKKTLYSIIYNDPWILSDWNVDQFCPKCVKIFPWTDRLSNESIRDWRAWDVPTQQAWGKWTKNLARRLRMNIKLHAALHHT